MVGSSLTGCWMLATSRTASRAETHDFWVASRNATGGCRFPRDLEKLAIYCRATQIDCSLLELDSYVETLGGPPPCNSDIIGI